ncbi:MAG: hypothetical protein HY352_01705 [Candidatus Omnitrophica bacterium]|nr:hypothetical protein [Candidatus Omnitrophota bacterium]
MRKRVPGPSVMITGAGCRLRVLEWTMRKELQRCGPLKEMSEGPSMGKRESEESCGCYVVGVQEAAVLVAYTVGLHAPTQQRRPPGRQEIGAG